MFLLTGSGSAGLARGRGRSTIATAAAQVVSRSVSGRARRRLARTLRISIVLAVVCIAVHLVVALARREKLLDQGAARDVGGLAQQVLDVRVQVVQAALGDGVGDVADGAGHVGEGAFLRARVAGLGGELGEERNLEVVKVFVVARQLPVAAILEHCLDDEPVLFLGEAVAGDAGLDRGVEVGRRVAHMAGRRLRGGLGARVATGLGLLLLEAEAVHTLLHLCLAGLELAEGDAAVLVLGGHLLPLLDAGDASLLEGVAGVDNGAVGGHVSNFDKRDGDQAGAAEPADGLGNEPLGVRLGNNDDGLTSLGVEFIGAFSDEIVHDDAVDHGATLAARLRESLDGRHGARGRRGFAVSRVVVRGLGGGGWSDAGALGLGAVSLGSAQGLEEGDGHQAAGVGQGWVACFVPVGVVLAADNVKEVASGEAQLLRGASCVVVERSNDLAGYKLAGAPRSVFEINRRHRARRSCRAGGEEVGQTFFGGTMATADFGVTEAVWALSFSPLIDRRRAYTREQTRLESVFV